MILKKPYAFLIKNFMIIHIILSGLMIFVCIKFREILAFIKEYINNTASISTADTIIGIPLYITIIAVIFISGAIFWLMKYKNKPKLLYLITIIIYVIFIIFASIADSSFSNLNYHIIDAQSIRLYRDTTNVMLILQYVFIIAMVIRTLGFDIKKFDFTSDIQDIEIANDDDEEIEVNIGIPTAKISRSARRHLRELKYYYDDNKLPIIIIGAVIGLIAIISIVPKFFGKERTHLSNETVSTYTFKMQVLNAYTTKQKYDGSDVSYDDKTFVIIKLKLVGLYGIKAKMDMNKYILKVGRKEYQPELTMYDNFKDIGYGYTNQKLPENEEKEYIISFLVDDKVINKSKTLIYTDLDLAEKKIIIKTTDIDRTKKISTANLGDELHYKNTVIGDGKIHIGSIEFGKRYDSVYSTYNKKLLKMEVDNKIEKYNNYDFFNYFVTLKCTKGNKTTTVDYKNKTNYNDNNAVYLEVPKDLETADTIYLEIRIRTNIYKYIIKDGKSKTTKKESK